MFYRRVRTVTCKGFTYLKEERGLTDETIDTFHLGCINESGQRFIDIPVQYNLDFRFNNSAIFPIFNVYNDLIGISARKLDYGTKKDLKYVNTIYPKTLHLYGLNVTWPYCLHNKSVYVVEGNVDMLMMYQHGIRNVVGMLGSTLTINQLCILSRFAEEIIFVPDGDTAGQKFLARMFGSKREVGLVTKCINQGLTFSSVQLPNTYDPDKFLKEHSSADLISLKQPLTPTIQQKLRRVVEGA